MEQAGEIQFPCLLFFGSRREKLEGKKNPRWTEAVLLLLQMLEEGSGAEHTAPAPPSSCNTDWKPHITFPHDLFYAFLAFFVVKN